MDKSTGSTQGPNCKKGFRAGLGEPEKVIKCENWPNCLKEEAKFGAAPSHALVCEGWPECLQKEN